MRRLIWMFVVAVAVIGLLGQAGLVSAQEADDELAAMRERLAEIEAEIAAMKPGGIILPSGVELELYGYVKVDAAYDTHATVPGNFALWVASEEDNSNDGQFNLTANQTRLGLILRGPNISESLHLGGVIEMDFYGSDTWGGQNTPQNKSGMRMRRAFLTLNWVESDFQILAGQEWDAFSPLFPETLNFLAAGHAGNLGFRRPQIRFTKGVPVDDVKLQFQTGIMRNIGRANAFSPAGETGADGYPGVFGRISASVPVSDQRSVTLGLSGHYAREELDRDVDGSKKDINSWSMNVDLTVPVASWVLFKGEAFKGQVLNEYSGGINQGVVNDDEVRSVGGWGAFTFGPFASPFGDPAAGGRWRYNLGASFEDVRARDVNNGGRTHNSQIFANVLCAISRRFTVGLELTRLDTSYKGESDADAWRVQTSAMYTF